MSTLHIWGPFAGYGTRRRHLGWLMDNQGIRANDLVEKVKENFQDRTIPDTRIHISWLTARGVLVENRPYFLLRRGLVTMALYINSFGKDLFISMVSYLKPPISNFRVILLSLMLVFWLYMSVVFPVALNNSVEGMLGSFGGGLFGGGPSVSAGGLFGLICLVGPLGFVNNVALFLFVVYSVYKWLSEKDILAGLRVKPNEFNEDDLMAMEKAVEQTVRISIDQIGLDPKALLPTSTKDSGGLLF